MRNRLRDRRMMGLAVAQAYLGMRKNRGGPFGAVIARNGRVIARGHNRVVGTNDPTAHAEVVAIRRASARLKKFDLSDCEIYSTCEPCPMCLAAIAWANIGTVFFGCTREDAEKIGFRDKAFYDLLGRKASKALKRIRLGRRECLGPFREWEQKKDRIPY
jgi:guanine deaminase